MEPGRLVCRPSAKSSTTAPTSSGQVATAASEWWGTACTCPHLVADLADRQTSKSPLDAVRLMREIPGRVPVKDHVESIACAGPDLLEQFAHNLGDELGPAPRLQKRVRVILSGHRVCAYTNIPGRIHPRLLILANSLKHRANIRSRGSHFLSFVGVQKRIEQCRVCY